MQVRATDSLKAYSQVYISQTDDLIRLLLPENFQTRPIYRRR